jgi:ATP-dependent Lhr-like helicase
MTPPTYHFLDEPVCAASALAALPGPLADWFRGRFGVPTVAQRLAWPALAAGGHLLLSAPTGAGKTLAAVLPVLGDLLIPPAPCGWSDSPLRALYLAPLKALVNDAARGLEAHLADLSAFLPPGTRLPRLLVRTGDSPPADRARLRDEPPEMLLTTPESLAVLLSQGSSAALLANLAWVVVDEVHALAGNKRGADLALSLERLAALVTSAGGREPRRVGLSATAAPLTEAARFLVGTGRPCAIARAAEHTALELALEPLPEGRRFLSALVARLADELPRRRAVLVFTNTRGLAERLAWALRRRMAGWDGLVAVHHSAISADRRRDVEERFKAGALRAVVSSTSLELGVDIGSVDLAVLVHPPGDVVRLLQRVGRAGHAPGGVRRGLILAASAAELLEAAVTMASGAAGQCEPLRLADAPLDVLCQQVLGACCARPADGSALFELARRAAPYAHLRREDFDDCLAYLRGLDREGALWLPARLREDGDCWRVSDARTAKLLRRNLGTILAEQTVGVLLRRAAAAGEGGEGGADAAPLLIGKVDEAFADRLQPGDRFLLDGRCLEYRALEEGAVVVEELAGRPRTPRWGGDGWPLSAELARRLFLLRVAAAEALRDGPAALVRLLEADYGLSGEAVGELAGYFQQQECVSEIPDAAGLLVEVVRAEGGAAYYFHTPLNRPGNDALARVAVARLARDLGRSALSVVADLGFVLQLRAELPDVAGVVRRVLSAEGFRDELDALLADSQALRGRFTRVAQTGLMLLRNPEGRRQRVGGPGWADRRLFEQVRQRDADFVLLRQALAEVRAGLCDADAAAAYAAGLPRLEVRCRWLRQPSPFAAAWTQPGVGEEAFAPTPAEALQRLHEELTRAHDPGGPGG